VVCAIHAGAAANRHERAAARARAGAKITFVTSLPS
jgi:hypothetical protein